MATTFYRNNKPYKHVDDRGRTTYIKDGKDPLSKKKRKKNLDVTYLKRDKQGKITIDKEKTERAKKKKVIIIPPKVTIKPPTINAKVRIEDIKKKQIVTTTYKNGIKKVDVVKSKPISRGEITAPIKKNVKRNYYLEVENYLTKERNKVLSKAESQRTAKEVALTSVTGISLLGLQTIRKVPVVVWRNIEALLSPIETAKALKRLATDPQAQAEVKRSIEKLGSRLERGDPDAASTVVAEILGTKVPIGKTLKVTGRTIKKLSPKYVKFKGDFVKIPKKPYTSPKAFLEGRVPPPIEKLLKVFKDEPSILLKIETVKTGALPLKEQVNIAGKTVTAVNSSVDQLTSWLKRKQIIRKPIPDEINFPQEIKNVLKKFDNGVKLNIKEFAKTNKWLQENVAPNITLLERSLYLDPKAGLRISRLGIQAKTRVATLKDILRGNFKLIDTQKPQVLIFENAKVAKFPKKLKDIENKLKKEKKLNTKETNRLIEWQVEKGSGKFKPIGSTIYQGGRELEVTLAPNEYIKRIKEIGFTYINKKKVTFVTAEVWKPPKNILDDITRANKGKLRDKALKNLEQDLSKKLGRKIKVETPKSIRRIKTDVPILRIKGKGLRIIRIPSRPRPSPRKTKTPRTGPSPPRPRPSPRKPKTPRIGPSPPRPRPSPRKPKTPRIGPSLPIKKPPIKKPPIKKPPIKLLNFNTKLKQNERLKFDMKVRVRGKIKKIRLGLPLNKAIKKAGGLVDKTTSRSFELIISGITKSKDTIKPNVLKKFRARKTKKVLKLVEKRKNAIDTAGEKRGLTLSKLLKSKKIKIKNKK